MIYSLKTSVKAQIQGLSCCAAIEKIILRIKKALAFPPFDL
jgi:hypothetical protein